jgi:hypothetical protein
MSKIAEYREALRALPEWEPYLLAESRLPGPRSNLELLEAAVQEGEKAFFERCLIYGPEQYATDDPHAFVVCCGVTGLGKLIGQGDATLIPTLRRFASDPRWRVREAVAMALQHWGDADLPGMLTELETWAPGNRLEQRAAVAGICEPRLLKDLAVQRRALALLDRITAGIVSAPDRKSAGFEALRKALGYGWSVLVAANPSLGQPIMQPWLTCPDPDVAWVMRENLKKNRIKSLTWSN